MVSTISAIYTLTTRSGDNVTVVVSAFILIDESYLCLQLLTYKHMRLILQCTLDP